MKLSDDIIICGKRAIARSFAKINLTLDIAGNRPDGYHSLESVMQTVGLCDMVIVDKTPYERKITTNKKFLPTNEKNLAYKACEAFYTHFGKNGGAKILIHKNIPVAAGLAGGSGNAAAVLAALNMLWANPFSDEELCKIGVEIGADVPFCLMGSTQKASGIGDVLTPLSDMPKCYVLLVTPPIQVSTQWAYKAFDEEQCASHSMTEKMEEALQNGDYYAVCDSLSNDLEAVTVKKYPVIRGIKEKMILNGANGALMSGSGSTVFGLFDDYKKAKASHDSFALMYKDVFLATI